MKKDSNNILLDEQNFEIIRKMILDCFIKDSINLRQKLLWSYNLLTLQNCVDKQIEILELNNNKNFTENETNHLKLFKEWSIFFLLDALVLDIKKPKILIEKENLK